MKGRIFLKAMAAFAVVILALAFSIYFAVRNHSKEIDGALLRGVFWALLLAGVLALLIARTVSTGLQRFISFAEQLSQGDVKARIGENQDGEIGGQRIPATQLLRSEKIEVHSQFCGCNGVHGGGYWRKCRRRAVNSTESRYKDCKNNKKP